MLWKLSSLFCFCFCKGEFDHGVCIQEKTDGEQRELVGRYRSILARYRREPGRYRGDVGAGVDRSVSTRSLFDCESGTSEEQASIIFANSSWVLWCGNNQVRNIQLKKNWTRARRRYKRVSIGVSRSSRICFVRGNLGRSALFSGFNAKA